MSFWGEVAPAWLGAIGTVGATSVAVYLAWQERRRAEVAESERDSLRDAAASLVASRVAGVLEKTPVVAVPTRLRHLGDGPPESWRAAVTNGADQTVTGVKAWVVHADGGKRDLLGSWAAIPPGQTLRHDEEVAVEQYNEAPYLLLTFTDADGRIWSRGADGVLERGEPQPGW